jgi:hypothetical protein
MFDRGKVVLGIVIFLVVVLFPVWYGLASGPGEVPKMGDVKQQTGAERCVRDLEWMRAEHMTLLDEWRDKVVREGLRDDPENPEGRREMSLTRTCLGCHTNYDNFCAKCHDYVGVEPYCWDCHHIVQKGS